MYKILTLFIFIFFIGCEIFASGTNPETSLPTTKDYFKKSSPFVILQAHINMGNLKYDYSYNKNKNFRTYHQQYNTKGFSLGIGYQLKQLQLTVTGVYSYANYWKPEHYIHSYITQGTDVDTLISTDFNRHGLPKKILTAQINLEYNFRLSKSLIFAPYVTYQAWKFNDDNFYPVIKNAGTFFELQNNYAYGGGISLKGVITENSMLFMKGGIIKNDFDPEGYFESLKVTNLHKYHEIMEISIGYHYKLFK